MTGLQNLITSVGNLVKLAIPVVFGLALLGFFWGLAKFIFQSGDEKAVDEGKRIMKWGLISLFLMTSVWGVIGFFQRDLLGNQNNSGIIQVQPLR